MTGCPPPDAVSAARAAVERIPDLVVHDGAVFASSLDIARVFGKRHDNVLFKIDALIAQAGGGLLGFKETPHVEPQSRQTYRAYEISRDGFALLAMGFTGAKALRFKLAYIAKFGVMEAELKAQAASFASLSAPSLNIYDLRRTLDP